MKIIIDTREQTPWTFPGIESERGTLATGDYSITGLQDLCSIERKSLDDFIGCLTGENRERFKKELLRLKAYRCRAVIIEATMQDILHHRYMGGIMPDSVIGSLASWQTRYDVPFVLAGDSTGAAHYCLAILRNFHRHCQEFCKQFKDM